ncbi:TrmH family RNA methyltransferase [Aneurinibacillus tyrosinisolvens]|uniref:TrmH family RNA methyltransferase n=1 Tax=Aneurinibacillus tyrosinisolvens TaxID=1443435 RepID=UPI00063F6A22|nr:RNA methyltransferase [Aneurinibacillus tyrosinisolvens]
MDVISSAQNPRIKQWAKLHIRKEREKAGLFLLEGPHLIEEACRFEAPIQAILLQDHIEEIPAWLDTYSARSQTPLFQTTAQVMEKLSETKSPQGMIAVVEMNRQVPRNLPEDFLLLMVDRLQDPGNLGTLIRTADAAGFHGVVIGEGSVDLYNGKAIRSTMGSLFHLPVWNADLAQFIAQTRSSYPDVRVIGTSLEESKLYNDVSYAGPVMLVIGNEGSGITENILAFTDENVIIPIYGKAESLNAAVAGSVLMYEAVRQRNDR